MEKKENKLKWEDVESAIDNLCKEDLKIWISDLLYLPEELDKAREEGYQEGVKDGIKGKVFNKVEIKEEAHIPKELIEKIREEGYEKGYERGVKYGTTGNTLTDFLNDTASYNSFHKGKPRVMRNGLSGEGFEIRVSKLNNKKK